MVPHSPSMEIFTQTEEHLALSSIFTHADCTPGVMFSLGYLLGCISHVSLHALPKKLCLCHFLKFAMKSIIFYRLSSTLRNSHQHRIKFSRISDSLNSNFVCKNIPDDQKPLLSFPPSMTNAIQRIAVMQLCISALTMRNGSTTIHHL